MFHDLATVSMYKFTIKPDECTECSVYLVSSWHLLLVIQCISQQPRRQFRVRVAMLEVQAHVRLSKPLFLEVAICFQLKM